MSTNNGEKGLGETGNWTEWGESYLSKTALTDIVSGSDAVEKGFRVVFDSSIENRFCVINPKDGTAI